MPMAVNGSVLCGRQERRKEAERMAREREELRRQQEQLRYEQEKRNSLKRGRDVGRDVDHRCVTRHFIQLWTLTRSVDNPAKVLHGFCCMGKSPLFQLFSFVRTAGWIFLRNLVLTKAHKLNCHYLVD